MRGYPLRNLCNLRSEVTQRRLRIRRPSGVRHHVRSVSYMLVTVRSQPHAHAAAVTASLPWRGSARHCWPQALDAVAATTKAGAQHRRHAIDQSLGRDLAKSTECAFEADRWCSGDQLCTCSRIMPIKVQSARRRTSADVRASRNSVRACQSVSEARLPSLHRPGTVRRRVTRPTRLHNTRCVTSCNLG